MGAEVIKIESPQGDSGIGAERHCPDFQSLHRNKRILTLDLKQPDGLNFFYKLVNRTDVVVKNYRPVVKGRLRIDFATLKAINARIVYASISGFGQDGPYRDRPGFVQIAQGYAVLMSITGLPGRGQIRDGIHVADSTVGIFAAQGILIALLEREPSGRVKWVQSSLLAAQIAILDLQARWTIVHEVPDQAGNNHATSISTGVFGTADAHINIATASNGMCLRLRRSLGIEEQATHPDYATDKARSTNRRALIAEVEAVTRGKTSMDWIDQLNRAGVPCGPIYSIDQVFADPQMQHLRLTLKIAHPTLGELVSSANRSSSAAASGKSAVRHPKPASTRRPSSASSGWALPKSTGCESGTWFRLWCRPRDGLTCARIN